MRFCLFLINLIVVILPLNAEPIHPTEQQTQFQLEKLYHTDAFNHKQRIDNRLEWVARENLSKPYILFPLGEGLTGIYDQQPRYRLDGFDCDTFVTTQLALALSNSPQTFKHCMDTLRYHGKRISFLNRNHFTSIDWNRSNQRLGVLKDITRDIKGENNKQLYKTAVGIIDKASWYQHTSANRIKLVGAPRSQIKARTYALQQAGKVFKPEKATIDYLPTGTLIDKNGQLKMAIVKQIPNGAIMEIVRPNWNLRDKIGTNLYVSHMGFVFWQNGTPYCLEASSEYKKVVAVPLQSYLQQMRKSPTIKGANFQIVPFKELAQSPCLKLSE